MNKIIIETLGNVVMAYWIDNDGRDDRHIILKSWFESEFTKRKLENFKKKELERTGRNLEFAVNL